MTLIQAAAAALLFTGCVSPDVSAPGNDFVVHDPSGRQVDIPPGSKVVPLPPIPGGRRHEHYARPAASIASLNAAAAGSTVGPWKRSFRQVGFQIVSIFSLDTMPPPGSLMLSTNLVDWIEVERPAFEGAENPRWIIVVARSVHVVQTETALAPGDPFELHFHWNASPNWFWRYEENPQP